MEKEKSDSKVQKRRGWKDNVIVFFLSFFSFKKRKNRCPYKKTNNE
jgi:hypothetical protein